MPDLDSLLAEVRACTICAADLPAGPRPVVQVGAGARVLIAGQAPGRKVHETGVPFDEPSGNRLREWMGVTAEQFYDPELVAILPKPCRAGASGGRTSCRFHTRALATGSGSAGIPGSTRRSFRR